MVGAPTGKITTMKNGQPDIPPNTPVILIDADGVTADEYARRTGLAPSTVRKMLADGRLPRIKKRTPGTEGKSSTVLVNLVKLAQQALEANY